MKSGLTHLRSLRDLVRAGGNTARANQTNSPRHPQDQKGWPLLQQENPNEEVPKGNDVMENGKMQTISKWEDERTSDNEVAEQTTVRPSELLAVSRGLDKRVAEDADQIINRLERYREGLEADEAKIAAALENVRADLKEVMQVIQALRPAMKVVGKICSRADEDRKLQETVRAIAKPGADMQ